MVHCARAWKETQEIYFPKLLESRAVTSLAMVNSHTQLAANRGLPPRANRDDGRRELPHQSHVGGVAVGVNFSKGQGCSLCWASYYLSRTHSVFLRLLLGVLACQELASCLLVSTPCYDSMVLPGSRVVKVQRFGMLSMTAQDISTNRHSSFREFFRD